MVGAQDDLRFDGTVIEKLRGDFIGALRALQTGCGVSL
jgi:hypothetical protein